MHARAARPRPELVEAAAVPIAGHQPALVVHLGSEGERLPAGACAGVDHHLAGPGLAGKRDQLAPFVLHLEEARLERAQREDVGASRERDAPRREPGRLDPRSFGAEDREQLIA